MTTDKTTTLLVSKVILISPITSLVSATDSFLAIAPIFDYTGTADTLCWGSFSYGLV